MVASLVERGIATKEMRLIARALRLMISLRRRFRASSLANFLKHLLPQGSEPLLRLLPYVSKVSSRKYLCPVMHVRSFLCLVFLSRL